ncbi:MAG: hypothetical protein KDC92_02600 [Bacteroidetes bacterium]|nr:hypothetical protein [Bacteroidota bacterium]
MGFSQSVYYEKVSAGPTSIQFVWYMDYKSITKLKQAVECGPGYFPNGEYNSFLEQYGIELDTEINTFYVRLGCTFPNESMDTALALIASILEAEPIDSSCIQNKMRIARQEADYYKNDPDTLLRREMMSNYRNRYLGHYGGFPLDFVINTPSHFSMVSSQDSSIIMNRLPIVNSGRKLWIRDLIEGFDSESSTYLVGNPKALKTLSLVYPSAKRAEKQIESIFWQELEAHLKTKFKDIEVYSPGEYHQFCYVINSKAVDWLKHKTQIEFEIENWIDKFEYQTFQVEAEKLKLESLASATNCTIAKQLILGQPILELNEKEFDLFKDYLKKQVVQTYVYGARQ